MDADALAGTEREIDPNLIPRVDDAAVLGVIRREMEALFGPRLQRLILFGSRARGDFRPDSDYDIAVVIEPPWAWADQHAATDKQYDIWRETGAWVDMKVMTEVHLAEPRWFYHDVRTEGRVF